MEIITFTTIVKKAKVDGVECVLFVWQIRTTKVL